MKMKMKKANQLTSSCCCCCCYCCGLCILGQFVMQLRRRRDLWFAIAS